jgi:hypothetical protein
MLQLGNSPHNIAVMTVYIPSIAEYMILPEIPKQLSPRTKIIHLDSHLSSHYVEPRSMVRISLTPTNE